ncbi:MAG: VCBS repeat-containing protein [Bryobacterales bacterium]
MLRSWALADARTRCSPARCDCFGAVAATLASPLEHSGRPAVAGAVGAADGVAVCDIDADGDADFFIGARVVGPAVTFFRRGADGWEKLVAEPEFLRIEAGGACHDIDGDGDSDVVFGADAGDNHIWWWENPFPDFDPAKPWTRHVIKSPGATSTTIRSSATSTAMARSSW